jgi:hypothetical protein
VLAEDQVQLPGLVLADLAKDHPADALVQARGFRGLLPGGAVVNQLKGNGGKVVLGIGEEQVDLLPLASLGAAFQIFQAQASPADVLDFGHGGGRREDGDHIHTRNRPLELPALWTHCYFSPGWPQHRRRLTNLASLGQPTAPQSQNPSRQARGGQDASGASKAA